MLALELEKMAIKGFMARLLREGLFDGFDGRAAEIAAETHISIDGGLEEGGFTPWGKLRPLVHDIIKLCGKPRHMKIVLSFREVNEIHSNSAALFLNLVYADDSVTFTTAASQREFALDKSLDTAWDEWVRGFFAGEGIPVRDRLEQAEKV